MILQTDMQTAKKVAEFRHFHLSPLCPDFPDFCGKMANRTENSGELRQMVSHSGSNRNCLSPVFAIDVSEAAV